MNRRKNRTSPVPAAAAKYLCMVLIAAFLILQFTGDRVSSTPFEDMSRAVSEAAVMDNMQAGDTQMIRRLYKLDPADYDGILLYYPSTNMGAEELLLVKLKDTAQADAVEAAVMQRWEAQRNVFEGYAVDPFELLGRYQLLVKGNYILYIVAEDPQPVIRAFESSL